MLRNKSRSIQKDQAMAPFGIHNDSFESLSSNKHGNSSFTVAGLFLGKGPKALSDSDSVMSSTSPLDLVKFPSFCSPFKVKTGSHSNSKVGLSMVNSLDDNSALGVEGNKSSFSPATNGTNIVFGPQVGNKSPGKIKCQGSSIFEIADASEPECGSRDIGRRHISGCTDISHLLAVNDFLSLCYSCCKELAGEDIYIYRGEKAFCSPSCRELEMVNDEPSIHLDNTTCSNHDPDDQESE